MPKRVGRIDAHVVVDRLRELYEAAGDREVEWFPASEELWSALVYADRRAARSVRRRWASRRCCACCCGGT
ncbi:hypothetical protein [Kitasatospora kifunensis]|uniref:Uncharacterized protein n=1 Tax=Kitasatospora kifunensis TaxID=58351 RepID=A0A7W7RAB8_KITKI|nr:hypothetical protein [Kitasatospora kifunensis]MBB4928249.1 hypothetical protein [Kitasatospora kifunensis]